MMYCGNWIRTTYGQVRTLWTHITGIWPDRLIPSDAWKSLGDYRTSTNPAVETDVFRGILFVFNRNDRNKVKLYKLLQNHKIPTLRISQKSALNYKKTAAMKSVLWGVNPKVGIPLDSFLQFVRNWKCIEIIMVLTLFVISFCWLNVLYLLKSITMKHCSQTANFIAIL